jgi:hypothetical protein
MRLRACLALILFATSACSYIPDSLRFELGGSTLEFKKKPVEPPPEPAPEEPDATVNDVQPS